MINLWDYLGGTPKRDTAEVIKSELEATKDEIEKLRTNPGQMLTIETEKDGTVQISTKSSDEDARKEVSKNIAGQLVWLVVFVVVAIIFFIGWSIFVSLQGPVVPSGGPSTDTETPTTRSFNVPLNSL